MINTSPADGYTLMVVDTTLLSVGPIFLNDLSFDPKKDFVPIAALARTPLFLAVNATTPIKTLDEFVAYVRAHPGQLNYGSAGVGSTHQLTMEAMKAALHLDIVHAPYHGTGEAVPALLGNHVQALWAAYPSLKGAVERGDIRLLAHNGSGIRRYCPSCRRWPIWFPASTWSRTLASMAAPEYRTTSFAQSPPTAARSSRKATWPRN